MNSQNYGEFQRALMMGISSDTPLRKIRVRNIEAPEKGKSGHNFEHEQVNLRLSEHFNAESAHFNEEIFNKIIEFGD